MSMIAMSGNHIGPLVVDTDIMLSGNLDGDAIVRPGCRFEMSGNMRGDIILEGDAVAAMSGNLSGTIRRAPSAQ
ncbi:hypothetical protein ACFSC3_00590 [Sphingomonas floccifaciens]|uniref:Polymer-forming cytoskeletal protein n=1 Tax=Sphingomonas floccifaciens TaxID=1844115 RepID=A0ABW4N820_9SPHN